MAIWASQANNTFPFILAGSGYVLDTETILTDAGRTVPLYQYTIMSQIASSGKWVPWLLANYNGTTGTQYPMGILMTDGGFTYQVYAAGDILNAMILVGGGCQVDSSQLVFDLGSTGVASPAALTGIPTVPTNLAMTAQRILELRGIFVTQTIAIDKLEN